ncbi:hypothetical protein DRH27_04400 [Candidatus Falkowbacteria bacterium]|nr:MAG: hypothetical protein DRH27_04400 [Candidatus Falkowbacteria bacterium]
MEELLLTGLGIYLLNRWGKKSPFDVGNIPPVDNAGKVIDRRDIKDYEQNACPWYWFPWKRPAVFNKVALSPGSRKRWLDLCDLWLEIRKIGAEIKFLEEPLIDGSVKKRFIEKIKEDIKDKKNRIAFLMSETKRIANVQMRSEELYKKVLANRFSEDEIKAFYQTRKDQIQNRVWPKNETNVVPIVSPGGGRPGDKISIEPGPTDPGSNVQMASPTNRKTWAYPNVEKKNYQTKVPVRANYNERARKQDLRIKAKSPGKRISKSGNVYYERRVNRSDYVRKNIDGSNIYM